MGRSEGFLTRLLTLHEELKVKTAAFCVLFERVSCLSRLLNLFLKNCRSELLLYAFLSVSLRYSTQGAGNRVKMARFKEFLVSEGCVKTKPGVNAGGGIIYWADTAVGTIAHHIYSAMCARPCLRTGSKIGKCGKGNNKRLVQSNYTSVRLTY